MKSVRKQKELDKANMNKRIKQLTGQKWVHQMLYKIKRRNILNRKRKIIQWWSEKV